MEFRGGQPHISLHTMRFHIHHTSDSSYIGCIGVAHNSLNSRPITTSTNGYKQISAGAVQWKRFCTHGVLRPELASTPDGDGRRRPSTYGGERRQRAHSAPTVTDGRRPTVTDRPHRSPTVSHATDRCRLVNMSVTAGQCTWTADADGRWNSATRHSIRRCPTSEFADRRSLRLPVYLLDLTIN